MRDRWTDIVSNRLDVASLPEDERDEVVEEVAAHLRECAEELEAAGMTDATNRALAQVSDWRRLAARIRQAKEKRMSANEVAPYPMSPPASLRRRFAWSVTFLVCFGAVAGFVAATLLPARYRSEAVIAFVPSQVPSDYVRLLNPQPLEDRLRAIQQSVLSRTRLERVINEFALFSKERVWRTMEEVVEDFRRDISVQPGTPSGSPEAGHAITISYTGSNPVTVMKVTERLAGYFKDVGQADGQRRAEGTAAFLESQSEEVGRRLLEQQARLAATHAPIDRRSQMETQVLETTYTKLLTDLEFARMQRDLERRQMGEQFVFLDTARLPERAIGPTRVQVVGFGALAGLSLGALLALVFTIIKFWSSKRPQPVTETA